ASMTPRRTRTRRPRKSGCAASTSSCEIPRRRPRCAGLGLFLVFLLVFLGLLLFLFVLLLPRGNEAADRRGRLEQAGKRTAVSRQNRRRGGTADPGIGQQARELVRRRPSKSSVGA